MRPDNALSVNVEGELPCFTPDVPIGNSMTVFLLFLENTSVKINGVYPLTDVADVVGLFYQNYLRLYYSYNNDVINLPRCFIGPHPYQRECGVIRVNSFQGMQDVFH